VHIEAKSQNKPENAENGENKPENAPKIVLKQENAYKPDNRGRKPSFFDGTFLKE